MTSASSARRHPSSTSDTWTVTTDSGRVLDHEQLNIATRFCAWCRRPLPASLRPDALYCGKSHRQAAWKFGRNRVRAERAAMPKRFAYFDPPYPRREHLYEGHRDYRPEPVDLGRLVAGAVMFFPDGWALSTSADALVDVLDIVTRTVALEYRSTVRVCAWFRGLSANAMHSPDVLVNAWEPVIVVGGRDKASRLGSGRRVDALAHKPKPRTTDPEHVIGAKPAEFCWWLFNLLGAQPGDELVDYFPGSGGVGKAFALLTAA